MNSLIVSAIVFALGFLLKMTKIPRDMLPQILYVVSNVTAYAIEILKQLIGAPAEADSLATVPDTTSVSNVVQDVTVVPDQLVDGSAGWVLATIWDWLGRKLIFGKILGKQRHR